MRVVVRSWNRAGLLRGDFAPGYIDIIFARCFGFALRGRRSLRDFYTGFALGLPLVGARIYIATNGSTNRRGIRVTK